MERRTESTNKKALLLNLDHSIFGTFAEIGGGQETARYFFRAGGASGTIAKSISAYDKAFSDAIYNNNKPGRYVSKYRLGQMLATEYSELDNITSQEKKDNTKLFSFANTVETLNYKKSNKCRGWIGIRYQLTPNDKWNEVIMHIHLLEDDAILQQKTLGIIGVNLIFACFYYWESPTLFLQSLMDMTDSSRVNVSMLKMSGPQLDYIDNRLLAVQLVKEGMSPAMMFDRSGEVQQPSEMLYKKNVLAFRGSFRPITYVGFDMLKTSYSIFKHDEDYTKKDTLALCEMTLNNILEDGHIDERDFLDRVNLLNGMGQNVMVSNFKEYYKLVNYFSEFNIKNIRIVIGIPTFEKVLQEHYYKHLKGGILEAFGKLFVQNMKLYVYPTIENGKIIDSCNIKLAEHLQCLYKYLIESRKILDIKNYREDRLHIRTRDVLQMIQGNVDGWEHFVPVYIEECIKRNSLFNYNGHKELIDRTKDLSKHCRPSEHKSKPSK
ncbi:MAG: hypothetical protein ACEPOV_12675 [Hyphomicrobiales bacterium]